MAFQTFRSVFRTSLNDPALLNAILLTATFAISRGILDQASLQYQTKTIQTVRQRVRNVEDATITSTLGAILLLAGIEVRLSPLFVVRTDLGDIQIRLGMRPQVELHLKAVRSLLEASKTGRAILTDGIKRAIFWYVHHTTPCTDHCLNELQARSICPCLDLLSSHDWAYYFHRDALATRRL